ncbi:isoleucine--tRNA ligase [Pedobacter duraquae]|uniref:Isoleucine--tRNA ligase n=1 Tax=Pedobacter duraquae TaxID=425511 RepID=A0A4V6PSD5_9SPHI|nr:isoleucine--tRNA ligase [Pedobacter duraquae]TDO21628.1 isoleucyl-tRNA synthetase [Pedobacter duraquae]
MYREFKQLELANIGKEILEFWKSENIFEKSISSRPKSNPFTFYEGPPSANGMPGIHHVMARAIKDIFCRYKTLKGYQVKRKGGWDTHGLPIELAVEKKLGITKIDIGVKISVEEYNAACREEVMRYTDIWNDLTEKMGYWVDLENPYVTYENNYIESLWWILKSFYDKGLLYKGYTVQPYSPAAGTGLSSHELNQPGTYKMLKDTSITAQFFLRRDQEHPLLSVVFDNAEEETAIIAWTTTPWTLPSNGALAVGEKIDYVKVKTFNQYTYLPLNVILAKDLVAKHFKKEAQDLDFSTYKGGDKLIPWTVVAEFKGADLVGLKYNQLLPYVTSDELTENAFRVIPADYVTTEDGTGIVHIASVFGADDFRVAKESGIPAVMIKDENGNELPLVDKQGKFVAEVTDFAGYYVKEEYYSDEQRKDPEFKSTDVLLAIKLKEDNKAFDVKKYEHSYPHCWRTDKPLLYYPLDSWFIRTTAVKEKMVALNKTINWKPESTGTGRFGNWLENLVDWNLSRSRYWGTPLPIWRTADGLEEKCIGSIAELNEEIKKAVDAGFMDAGFELKDMHRPYVDNVILVSNTGERMVREADMIDVWFDSGAMPYAQWHFPFENQEEFENAYPADFIAEGVDQTRGWFFTLHAIAVMLSESSEEIKAVNAKTGNAGVAFKNVVSNGLVLDKNGNKMSKRLGNGVDPFSTIDTYSADATRWYMISNASPWDNLKFNMDGLDEVRRKFFGTLYNTYSFFALYANIDKFEIDPANETPVAERSELDRWILSMLQTLINEVDESYNTYEPTKAARAIQNFVDEHLSNWYIRLSRRRFWKGEMTDDKKAAYETLYTCLTSIAQLMSPVAPFFADWLYQNLTVNAVEKSESVHLTLWKTADATLIDTELNERMLLAQDISSMVLSLRKKSSINVRQPLAKILIPVLDQKLADRVELVKELILSETNIKNIEYITDTAGFIKKKIKPNFKALGPKVGKDMKLVADAITGLDQTQIAELEKNGEVTIKISNAGTDSSYVVSNTDLEIIAEDIPGWQVTNLGSLTVALDVTVTEELKQEGLSRELINRVQNLRKELGFEVTDRITVSLQKDNLIEQAVAQHKAYICSEILAEKLELTDTLTNANKIVIDDVELQISITKL